jgi:parallel beta-helix repeat protein
MAENFYTILTNVGKAKIANATALGTKVNLTHLAVGDSNGSYYNPTQEQTALKHEVWRGAINSIKIDDQNPNWLIVEIVIPADVGGFTVREAGVFDDQGDLIAIGKYPETYKPVLASGSAKDLFVRMILEVTNAATVTLKVDPSIILATKKDLDAHTSRKDNPHNVTAAQIGASRTATVVIAASDSSENSKKAADVVIPAGSTNAQETINHVMLTMIPPSGGKVVLMEGTYVVSNSIRLSNNVTLEGMGRGTIIRAKDDISDNSVVIHLITNIDQSNGNEGIIIRDLTVDGNKSNQREGTGGARGIFFSRVSHALIQSVLVKDTNYHAIYLHYSRHNSVVGNTIIDSKAGIGMGSSDFNLIADNKLLNVQEDGIVINSCQYNEFSGNEIAECGKHGVIIAAGSNHAILNNRIMGSGTTGIYLSNTSYNNVQGNTIRKLSSQTPHGIRIGGNSEKNLVTNNDLYDSGSVAFSDSGTDTVTTPGNRIQ